MLRFLAHAVRSAITAIAELLVFTATTSLSAQVVQRIKAIENEVKFLVVGADTYNRDRDIASMDAIRVDDVQGIAHIISTDHTSRDDKGENKQGQLI